MWRRVLTALRMSLSILPMVGTAAQARIDSAPQISEWEKIVREDTAEAYARYMLENPNSNHIQEAAARIEVLENAPVQVATVVRHSDLPEIPDGTVFASSGAERLGNI